MTFLEKPKNTGLDDGKCALCETPNVDEDNRSFGCGYLVCEGCCTNISLMGPHLILEHQDSDEDEDDEPRGAGVPLSSGTCAALARVTGIPVADLVGQGR